MADKDGVEGRGRGAHGEDGEKRELKWIGSNGGVGERRNDGERSGG